MPRSFLVKQQRTEEEILEKIAGQAQVDVLRLPPPLLMVRRRGTPLAPPLEKTHTMSLSSPPPLITNYHNANVRLKEGLKEVHSNQALPLDASPHPLAGSRLNYSRSIMNYEHSKQMASELREFFYTELKQREEPSYFTHAHELSSFRFPTSGCVVFSPPNFPSAHGELLRTHPASTLLVAENEKLLARAQMLQPNSTTVVNTSDMVYLPAKHPATHPGSLEPAEGLRVQIKSEPDELRREHNSEFEMEIKTEPRSLGFMDENEVEIKRVSVMGDESSAEVNTDDIVLPSSPGASSCHIGREGLDRVEVNRDVIKKVARKYRYTCDVCGKSFSRSNTLTTHKRIHTGDKPFHCEQCGRAFRQPGNLTRHRLTHTTVKPYVCPQCDKAFNRASNLHTHMRTHTNYKPFVCDFCGKGFHQKIDMKIHRYTHTGEKPHKCQKCGRGFKQLTHLTYHMRTHSEERLYKCEYCGKGFNQKGNLQAHIYGHTGQRPFKCELCGKGFTLASTLNTHKRTHASKKPFECQFCGKSFYQKNALKTHYIASHPFANGVSLL